MFYYGCSGGLKLIMYYYQFLFIDINFQPPLITTTVPYGSLAASETGLLKIGLKTKDMMAAELQLI